MADNYYERYWDEDGFQPTGGLHPVLESLLQRVAGAGDDCLDVGCGDGRTSGVWLSANTRSYLGLDISETALAQARELGLEVRRIDDAAELPLADETFDAVTCLDVLEHLFEPARAAAEIHRVLRPGGRLLATVPNIGHWRPRVELAALARWNPYGTPEAAHRPWADPHIRFFTARTLRRMLEEAWFERIDLGAYGPPFLQDLPGLRGLVADGATTLRHTRLLPGLLGRRIHAIAHKPER